MAVFSTKRINTQAQALLAELEEFCGVHFDARAVAALEIVEKHLKGIGHDLNADNIKAEIETKMSAPADGGGVDEGLGDRRASGLDTDAGAGRGDGAGGDSPDPQEPANGGAENPQVAANSGGDSGHTEVVPLTDEEVQALIAATVPRPTEPIGPAIILDNIQLPEGDDAA